MLNTYVKSGHIIGSQRYFTMDGQFMNMTDARTGLTTLSEFVGKSKLIFGCHKNLIEKAPRCIIVQNDTFTDAKTCLVVDSDLLVHCFELPDFQKITISGCELTYDTTRNFKLPERNLMHTSRLKSNEMIFESDIKKNLECSNNLKVSQFKDTTRKK